MRSERKYGKRKIPREIFSSKNTRIFFFSVVWRLETLEQIYDFFTTNALIGQWNPPGNFVFLRQCIVVENDVNKERNICFDSMVLKEIKLGTLKMSLFRLQIIRIRKIDFCCLCITFFIWFIKCMRLRVHLQWRLHRSYWIF